LPGGERDLLYRSSRLRLAVEFLLLFAIAIGLQQFIVTGSGYPNPLWLPVVVLSLEHGLAAGVAATLVASGVQYSGGLPPPLITDDMYSYIGRVATEPVSWACVALLIGHFRSRQIANFAELQAELAERTEQCAVVADLCTDLRSRTEMLERHIAANAQATNVDVTQAIRDLDDASWDNFAERLTRFVFLLTGASEFTVFVLRDDALKTVFQPHEQAGAVEQTIPAGDPLVAAVLEERRTLSAAQADGRALLGNRGLYAVPLLDHRTPAQAAGMFVLGGAALEDFPDDIERRVALVAPEIARLLDRIALFESWHAAAAPGLANGREAAGRPEDAGAQRDAGARRAAARRGNGPDREVTLQ
jgi:hypothetical protein